MFILLIRAATRGDLDLSVCMCERNDTGYHTELIIYINKNYIFL